MLESMCPPQGICWWMGAGGGCWKECGVITTRCYWAQKCDVCCSRVRHMCLFMLIIFTTIRLLKNVMFVCFGKVILVSYVLKPCVVTASCCCIVSRNVHSKSRERAFWFCLPTLLPIRGSSSHVRCERLIMQVTCMIYCSYGRLPLLRMLAFRIEREFLFLLY